MSSGGKGDEQTTTQSVQFPSFIVGPATQTSANLLGLAPQGIQLDPATQNFLDQLFGGSFLGQGEDFNAQLQSATNQIIPQVASTFASAGRGTGGLAQEAAASGIGDAFAGLLNAERNRQMQALPFAFQQAQSPFTQQLSFLQALLGSPTGGTQTQTSDPGFLSTLGAGVGMAGGLFGPFGAFSDSRLKRFITRIGEMFGFPAYRFKYIWDDKWHIGVMADDVVKVMPSAVSFVNGYMVVDYWKVSQSDG